MLIYRQNLEQLTPITPLLLPFNNAVEAKQAIIKIGFKNGEPCVWYQADCDESEKHADNEFVIVGIGTGHKHEKLAKENYLDTLIFNDTFVIHYFLILPNFKEDVGTGNA